MSLEQENKMNRDELISAMLQKKTIMNEKDQEIKILHMTESNMFISHCDNDCEYVSAIRSAYFWELKAKPKVKYWLWKYKSNKNSGLMITDFYMNDDFESTTGSCNKAAMQNAFYKEKLLYTEHEE